MIILGIDPGLDRTGFAFVRSEAGVLTPLAFGVIQTDAEHPTAQRLVTIETDLKELAKPYKAKGDAQAEELELAIEIFVPSPHVAHNAPKVLQARGVVLLFAEHRKWRIHEYTPGTVKSAMTGNGRATKSEMKEAVASYFNFERITGPDDAADALAIAYTHHAAKEGGLL